MTVLASQEGYLLLITFCLVLSTLTILWSWRKNSTELFFVANRNVGTTLGAFSSAAAWIWAPALFISSQQAYNLGLAGIFWFAVPNALALVLFAVLASRMRKVMSRGYTLPEFVRHRLGTRCHSLYIVAILVAQTYAVIVQLTGSLLLLNLLTGISKITLLLILATLFLALSSLRGLRSSLMTDIVKVVMIAVVVLIVVPWTIMAAGGWEAVRDGFGGASGEHGNILDWRVAWSSGVPFIITLFSGVAIDQQQWQRAFAVRRDRVLPTFILAAILFAVVPAALSILGFIAANGNLQLQIDNPQLSGAAAVAQLLPKAGVILFAVMILAGLVSAGSSALCAVGSVGGIDIYKQYLNKNAGTGQVIWISRLCTGIVLLVAMTVAMLPNVQILYLVFLVGSFRAALLFPTILALFWPRLSSAAAFYGILFGMATGVPLFIYGSIVQNATIASFGSLVPIGISALFCVVGSTLGRQSFDYGRQLKQYSSEQDLSL
jgi:urea-proton symporter